MQMQNYFFSSVLCFTVKEVKAKEICVGKPSPWGWALTHDGRTESIQSENKSYSRGFFFSFFHTANSFLLCLSGCHGEQYVSF